MIEDIWDRIVEEFEYFISFEWIGDIGEFFSGLFENLGELSITGMIGGLIGIGLTKMTLGKINSFNALSGIGKIFWSIIYYAFAFILTYIMVKRVFDD